MQVLTRDSVTVSVDAVVYYRVSNATVSVANVENAHHSTRLLAQTTLRNILGTKNLHEILSDRESISGSMQVNNYMPKYPICIISQHACLAFILHWNNKSSNLQRAVLSSLERRTKTFSRDCKCFHAARQLKYISDYKTHFSFLWIGVFFYPYAKNKSTLTEQALIFWSKSQNQYQ